MTEKLKEIIKEEVEKLPKEMREVINAFDWIKITEEIGKENYLNEAEINNFQLETFLVLIGATDAEFYPINIENQVKISKNEAISIAKQTIDKMFNPMAKILEEGIKNNLKDKKPSPEQTLNFILSGGDYSAFIAPSQTNNSLEEEKSPTPVRPVTLQDIKDKLLRDKK